MLLLHLWCGFQFFSIQTRRLLSNSLPLGTSGGRAGKNPPANAGHECGPWSRKTPRGATKPSHHDHWGQVLQRLQPAPEVWAPQPRVAPTQEKAHTEQPRPSALINKQIKPFKKIYNFSGITNFTINMGYFSFLNTNTQLHLIIQFLPYSFCPLYKYVNPPRELATLPVSKSSPPFLSLAHTNKAFCPYCYTKTDPVKGPVASILTNASMVSF